MSATKTYILIHGAWHGSWCWKYVAPLLRAKGHEVLVPDLPGHGDNHTIPFAKINLASYVDYLAHLIHTAKYPVILVGHSLAGVTISQLAENMPTQIERLIYVAGFVPGNQESMLDEAGKATTPGLSTEIVFNTKANEIHLTVSPKLKAALYNSCTTEDAAWAISLLTREPFQPFANRIHVSNEKFTKVKKAYIECLQDLSVPVFEQRRMYEKLACAVISLEADHSPFLSAPQALTDALISFS
jgi:pimeloyl-ACP methyl ester carboxylesterase